MHCHALIVKRLENLYGIFNILYSCEKVYISIKRFELSRPFHFERIEVGTNHHYFDGKLEARENFVHVFHQI